MARSGGDIISAARRRFLARSFTAPKTMTATPTTRTAITPTDHGSTRSACHITFRAWVPIERREGQRFESWVERQIREATERGEFDNLPGAGQPIPGLNGRDDEDWWVKGFLEREKIPLPLPTTLALRREIADLPETLADVPDEESVREIVAHLNERIRDTHRRPVDGPPIVLRVVDADRAVADWAARRG